MGTTYNYRSMTYEQYGWPDLVHSAPNMADRPHVEAKPQDGDAGSYNCMLCRLGPRRIVECSGECKRAVRL